MCTQLESGAAFAQAKMPQCGRRVDALQMRLVRPFSPTNARVPAAPHRGEMARVPRWSHG
jgi:hypothetical protein